MTTATSATVDANGALPHAFRAPEPVPDLSGWIETHHAEIDDALARAGAVVLRGFEVAGPEEFEHVAMALTRDLLTENGEHTPVPGSGHVQVPVAFPADKVLLQHNENSFNARWPQRLIFCCVEVPEQGGESTLADSRRVYASLPPDLREEFERRGVRYERTFQPGLGVSWQQLYGTEDRAVVEQKCRAGGVEVEWLANGGLRTTAVRPAAIDHPVTGQRCWFAQIQHWHTGFLDPDTQASLAALFPRPEDRPRRCRFGDGGEIDEETVEALRYAYDQAEVSMGWGVGDVLVVDNVATSHGRRPYQGKRTLLVALGDESSFDDLSVDGSGADAGAAE